MCGSQHFFVPLNFDSASLSMGRNSKLMPELADSAIRVFINLHTHVLEAIHSPMLQIPYSALAPVPLVRWYGLATSPSDRWPSRNGNAL